MNNTQAIQVLENLVIQVMAAGGFKQFEAIDQARQALTIIKKSLAAVVEGEKDSQQ